MYETSSYFLRYFTLNNGECYKFPNSYGRVVWLRDKSATRLECSTRRSLLYECQMTEVRPKPHYPDNHLTIIRLDLLSSMPPKFYFN